MWFGRWTAVAPVCQLFVVPWGVSAAWLAGEETRGWEAQHSCPSPDAEEGQKSSVCVYVFAWLPHYSSPPLFWVLNKMGLFLGVRVNKVCEQVKLTGDSLALPSAVRFVSVLPLISTHHFPKDHVLLSFTLAFSPPFPTTFSLLLFLPSLVVSLSPVPSISPFPHKAVFHRSPCSLE